MQPESDRSLNVVAVVGLALVGVLAAAGAALLVFTPPEAESPAPVAVTDTEREPTPAAPDPEEPFMSPEAPESEYPRQGVTVLDVMSGVWEAREREDTAWLARVLESTAQKDTLDEDDLHAAHRQFLWSSTDGMWSRAWQAWTQQAYTVAEDGDRAELIMQVGGALGELRFQFIRIDGGWYFAGI